MTTLDLNYSQSDALDALRRGAPNGSVVVAELVNGKLQCHVIDDALGTAIRSVVKEHVASREITRNQRPLTKVDP
jgi:hypothetical protein